MFDFDAPAPALYDDYGDAGNAFRRRGANCAYGMGMGCRIELARRNGGRGAGVMSFRDFRARFLIPIKDGNGKRGLRAPKTL